MAGLLVAVVHPALQGQSVGLGYTADVLFSNVNDGTYTQYEGLAVHDGTLYVGNFRQVMQYQVSTGTLSRYSANRGVPGNNGINFVAYANDQVYLSYYISYASPYPSAFGSVSAGGSFAKVGDVQGHYDAAVAPNGDFYYVANPDVDGDSYGDGSRIYRFSTSTLESVEVAYVGGASGGLTFDAAGNLYYSAFDAGTVIRYTEAQLAQGALGLADADFSFAVAGPGKLALAGANELLVGVTDADTFEQSILRYDLSTGSLLGTLFSGEGQYLQFAHDGGTTYVISQSWDFGGDYGSTVYAVTALVPEAAHAGLWMAGLGLVWVVTRRRR